MAEEKEYVIGYHDQPKLRRYVVDFKLSTAQYNNEGDKHKNDLSITEIRVTPIKNFSSEEQVKASSTTFARVSTF